MVSEESTCTVLLRARRLLLLLLLAAGSKERRCSVCGITFKITSNMERKQKNDLRQSEHERIPPHPKHTHIKKDFFIYGNSVYGPSSWAHTKGDTSDIAIVQPAEHPRTSPPGSRVSEHMLRYPPAYVCCSGLSRKQWRLALSTLEKIFEV